MSRLVSFRGLIQNFRRTSPPLSYGSLPPPRLDKQAPPWKKIAVFVREYHVEWFPKNGCSEKNMNCKLKLHSKRFYWQILGAVTGLKFVQMLALDYPYATVLASAIFPRKINFFSGIERREAQQFIFFSEQLFYRNIIRHTLWFSYKHCIFSRGFLLVKMASKTVTISIRS